MSRKPIEPDAQDELDKLKMEVAQELGVNTNNNPKNDYLGNLPTREAGMSGKIENAGNVGGEMVRRMIEESERRLARENKRNDSRK